MVWRSLRLNGATRIQQNLSTFFQESHLANQRFHLLRTSQRFRHSVAVFHKQLSISITSTTTDTTTTKRVLQTLWNSTMSFISTEDAADAITASVLTLPGNVFPMFAIELSWMNTARLFFRWILLQRTEQSDHSVARIISRKLTKLIIRMKPLNLNQLILKFFLPYLPIAKD